MSNQGKAQKEAQNMVKRKCLSVTMEELEEVTGEREAWASPLKLLPLGPSCFMLAFWFHLTSQKHTIYAKLSQGINEQGNMCIFGLL